jgi:hypothetical protein
MKEAFKLLESFNKWWYGESKKIGFKVKPKRKYRKRKRK